MTARRNNEGNRIMSQTVPYEGMAIRYAETDGRRPQHILGGDPHDGSAAESPAFAAGGLPSEAAGRRSFSI